MSTHMIRPPRRLLLRVALGAALLVAPLAALATPPAGQLLAPVVIEDLDGKTRELPDRSVPIVLIYEDANAGSQNVRASALVDKVSGNPANKGKVEAVVVADVAKWNWWPAKKFAIKEMRRI